MEALLKVQSPGDLLDPDGFLRVLGDFLDSMDGVPGETLVNLWKEEMQMTLGTIPWYPILMLIEPERLLDVPRT